MKESVESIDTGEITLKTRDIGKDSVDRLNFFEKDMSLPAEAFMQRTIEKAQA